MSIPVIVIVDVGKTNKKIILFDEHYHLQHEESLQLPETSDEDGFPCEDIAALSSWIVQSVEQICSNHKYDVRAINFSAYGASFVHLDKNNKPVTPLYNYLKPYPEQLQKKFYNDNGGEENFSLATSSPVLGSLNSGMQLYRLKYEKPSVFAQIKYSLHLPQYLSYLICQCMATDITSVGCHTNLWHFDKDDYHPWVYNEELHSLFSSMRPSDEPIGVYKSSSKEIPVGIGLHDSSAALIPYLANFHEPFILLSTGTWCISLNPFNHIPLTKSELDQDCLCYLTYQGKPVKASRLFAGYIHEQQARRLAEYFETSSEHYIDVACNIELLNTLKNKNSGSSFEERNLSEFENYETAYHQLVLDLVSLQVKSTKLVLSGAPVTRIFVDGGFSKNKIYMYLLAESFPEINIIPASVPQATSLGAALSIHKYWNREKILKLKF